MSTKTINKVVENMKDTKLGLENEINEINNKIEYNQKKIEEGRGSDNIERLLNRLETDKIELNEQLEELNREIIEAALTGQIDINKRRIGRPKKKNKMNNVRVTFMINPDLIEEFRTICDNNDLGYSNVIEKRMRLWIKKMGEEGKA